MNVEKAYQYFSEKINSLQIEYESLDEDAQMCGLMCYEQRQAREYAVFRREQIDNEINEIKEIMELTRGD